MCWSYNFCKQHVSVADRQWKKSLSGLWAGFLAFEHCQPQNLSLNKGLETSASDISVTKKYGRGKNLKVIIFIFSNERKRVNVCERVIVCVCVWEREREREREDPSIDVEFSVPRQGQSPIFLRNHFSKRWLLIIKVWKLISSWVHTCRCRMLPLRKLTIATCNWSQTGVISL